MDISVNLLKKRRGISEKLWQTEYKLFRSVVVAFLVLTVVVLVVFLWTLLLSRRISAVVQDSEKVRAQFAGLEGANVQQLYLKNRLKLLQQFFLERVSTREALERVFAIDIPGVVVLDVSFETDTLISMRIGALGVGELEKAYEFFSEAEDMFFNKVVNRGVTRVDDGSYTMEIELTVPKGST